MKVTKLINGLLLITLACCSPLSLAEDAIDQYDNQELLPPIIMEEQVDEGNDPSILTYQLNIGNSIESPMTVASEEDLEWRIRAQKPERAFGQLMMDMIFDKGVDYVDPQVLGSYASQVGSMTVNNNWTGWTYGNDSSQKWIDIKLNHIDIDSDTFLKSGASLQLSFNDPTRVTIEMSHFGGKITYFCSAKVEFDGEARFEPLNIEPDLSSTGQIGFEVEIDFDMNVNSAADEIAISPTFTVSAPKGFIYNLGVNADHWALHSGKKDQVENSLRNRLENMVPAIAEEYFSYIETAAKEVIATDLNIPSISIAQYPEAWKTNIETIDRPYDSGSYLKAAFDPVQYLLWKGNITAAKAMLMQAVICDNPDVLFSEGNNELSTIDDISFMADMQRWDYRDPSGYQASTVDEYCQTMLASDGSFILGDASKRPMEGKWTEAWGSSMQMSPLLISGNALPLVRQYRYSTIYNVTDEVSVYDKDRVAEYEADVSYVTDYTNAWTYECIGIPTPSNETGPANETVLSPVAIDCNEPPPPMPNIEDYDINYTQEIPRGTGTCELEMRVYSREPYRLASNKPLLFLHGGSWKVRSGGFALLESEISALTEQGFTVFAPFYRTIGDDSEAPEACTGADWMNINSGSASSDVEKAFKMVQDKSSYYQFSDDQIYLWGQSAGAHMALGLLARHPDTVKKAVVMYPPADLGIFLSAYNSGSYGNYGGLIPILEDLVGVDLTSMDLGEVYITRNSYLNGDPGNRIDVDSPPVFIMHGKSDYTVPVDQARSLCSAYGTKAINQSNVYREEYYCGDQGSMLHEILGAGHLFDHVVSNGLQQSNNLEIRKSMEYAIRWLDSTGRGEVKDIDAPVIEGFKVVRIEDHPEISVKISGLTLSEGTAIILKAKDNSGIVGINGANCQEGLNFSPDLDGFWVCPQFEEQGFHKLSLTAEDNNGNLSEPVAVQFEVPDYAPNILATMSSTNGNSVRISGVAFDANNDLQSVSVLIGTNEYDCLPGLPWVCDITLPAGTYSNAVAIAYDIAGNVSAEKSVPSFTIAATSHAPTIDSFDVTCQSNGECRIFGTASDLDGDLVAVSVKVDSNDIVMATGTSNWEYTVTLEPGIHTFRATVEDSEQQWGDSGVIEREIANVATCQQFTANLEEHLTNDRVWSEYTGTCWGSFCYGGQWNIYTTGSNVLISHDGGETHTLHEMSNDSGTWWPGECSEDPVAPVVDSVTEPVITIVNETESEITFRAVVTGTASDANGDLKEVKIAAGMESAVCQGTTEFTCEVDFIMPKSSLPTEGQFIIGAVDEEDNWSETVTTEKVTLEEEDSVAPVIDSVNKPVVEKIGETADVITFRVTITGEASDANGDLQEIIIGVGMGHQVCQGTSQFNCVVDIPISKNTLPTNGYFPITAVDEAGNTSVAVHSQDVIFADTGVCVTANNPDHVETGRAWVCSVSWGIAQGCATGSDDAIGNQYMSSSLQEQSPDYWVKVDSCP